MMIQQLEPVCMMSPFLKSTPDPVTIGYTIQGVQRNMTIARRIKSVFELPIYLRHSVVNLFSHV